MTATGKILKRELAAGARHDDRWSWDGICSLESVGLKHVPGRRNVEGQRSTGCALVRGRKARPGS